MFRIPHLPRGMTLLELMLALSITSMVGGATAMLMVGAANTSKFVNTSGDAVWQIDNSLRRITHNLRAGSSLDSPSSTAPTNAFTVHTQPDAGNGNVTYQVSYQLAGTNLQETDSRYGTNTIAQNVTAFSATRVSIASPVTVSITLTIGTSPPTTRTFVVLCRNL